MRQVFRNDGISLCKVENAGIDRMDRIRAKGKIERPGCRYEQMLAEHWDVCVCVYVCDFD